MRFLQEAISYGTGIDVEIKEVLSRVQKVKAESLDDAINKGNGYVLCRADSPWSRGHEGS